tara:strand:- start:323 stop:574 length:252 start_codon:yes stop_codon:yes gene_type:complete
MTSAYKIVARYRSIDKRPSWDRGGKEGTQVKKRIYVSFEDFQRYGSKLADRWDRFCKWDVSAYVLIENKWEKHQLPKGNKEQK